MWKYIKNWLTIIARKFYKNKATHQVIVIKVSLEKHPDADSLSIIRHEGYQVVVRTQEWEDGMLGAYILPDSLVPVDNPAFAFFKETNGSDIKNGYYRVRARRFRGEWSMGLLVAAPLGSRVGDDVADILGVKHYSPPEPKRSRPGMSGKMIKAQCAPTPITNFHIPNYDVDPFRKYANKCFSQGEIVWVTEKIHGTNARFMYDGNKFHCGSHTTWKKSKDDPAYVRATWMDRLTGVKKEAPPPTDCVWWECLHQYPKLKEYLQANPNTVVYGEIYGWVQDLRYGHSKDTFSLAVFDVMKNGKWMNAEDGYREMVEAGIPTVPFIKKCEYDYDALIQMAEGKTLIPGADHLREGIVVKSYIERVVHKVGRCNLKIVSNSYLERAGK